MFAKIKMGVWVSFPGRLPAETPNAMREKTNNNWRNKAEDAFAFALRLSDRQARKVMLAIACSYVSLSQRAEKPAAKDDDGSSG